MNWLVWLVMVPVGLMVGLIFLLLISFFISKIFNKKEPWKFFVCLNHLLGWIMKFFIDLFHLLGSLIAWIMKKANIFLALGIIVLIILTFLTGIIALSIKRPYMYLYLVGGSCALAYLSPKIVYFAIKWVTELNNYTNMKDLTEKFEGNSGKLYFRILTYATLLCLYMIRNYNTFGGYKYDSELIHNIIDVSAEALLTFVIVDTILTLYNEKKAKE